MLGEFNLRAACVAVQAMKIHEDNHSAVLLQVLCKFDAGALLLLGADEVILSAFLADKAKTTWRPCTKEWKKCLKRCSAFWRAVGEGKRAWRFSFKIKREPPQNIHQ